MLDGKGNNFGYFIAVEYLDPIDDLLEPLFSSLHQHQVFRAALQISFPLVNRGDVRNNIDASGEPILNKIFGYLLSGFSAVDRAKDNVACRHA